MGLVLTHLHEEAKVVEEIDRISDLPEEILCHILSFLPTKYAVATTILSTKWKHLFTSLINLDLDDSLLLHPQEGNGNQVDRMSFMNFVDRVLSLRDTLPINKFRLKCYNCDIRRVKAWIRAALLQKVQELDLCISVKEYEYVFSKEYEYVMLPCTELFNSETLLVLKLSAEFYYGVPQKVCLPNVKKIYLDKVIFLEDQWFQELLSGCPVLEDLAMQGCSLWLIGTCNISAPALKSLTIDCFVQHAPSTECKYDIVIDAPNLLYLKYTDYVGFSLKNLQSLVEAHLDIRGRDRTYERVVDHILEGISEVQFLHLSGDSIETFTGSFLGHLPKFNKLTRLELGINRYAGWLRLPCLLKCVPFLEKLVFVEGLLDDLEFEHPYFTNWCHMDAPLSLLLHLEAIEIRYYQGSLTELNVIKYFLKNAMILKILTMHTYGMADRTLLDERKKISMLPRSSLTCLVEIF